MRLRFRVVTAVTFETNVGIFGLFGPLRLEMFRDFDRTKLLAASHDRFMTYETGAPIFGDEQVDRLGQIPRAICSRGRNLRTILRSLTGKGDVLSANSMAVSTTDDGMQRVGPLLLNILMAFMANRIGHEGTGPRGDLLQRVGSIRSVATLLLAKRSRHKLLSCEQHPGASHN